MKKISHANRGKHSERAVEKINQLYKKLGLAVIEKVAVPSIHMSLRTRSLQNFLKKGEYVAIRQPSTVDYQGCLRGGKTVAFDCKETRKDYLPAKNFHEHQWQYLKDMDSLGAVCFLLVVLRRTFKMEVYKVPISIIDSPKTVSQYSQELIIGGGRAVSNWDYLELIN